MYIRTLKEAHDIAGSIGKTTKMSCFSYGLPANKAKFVPEVCRKYNWPIPPYYGCRVGSWLSKNKRTTCYNCYAYERGNYTYPDVHVGQTKRLVGVYKRPVWKHAMVRLIEHYTHKTDIPYFRWFDSGDIVDEQMLLDIIWIANECRWVSFWLPTQERKIINRVFVRDRIKKPDNLIIRVSNVYKNDHKPFTRHDFIHSSSVSTTDEYNCPAPSQDNACMDCRDCWDTSINHIIYKEH